MPTDQQGRPDVETYIHRIGRTGRFGRQGLSINFVYDRKSFETMQVIEKELKRPIVKVGTEDFDVMEKVRSSALFWSAYHFRQIKTDCERPGVQTLKSALKS